MQTNFRQISQKDVYFKDSISISTPKVPPPITTQLLKLRETIKEASERLEKVSILPHCLSSEVISTMLAFRNADLFDESSKINKILFGIKVIITEITLPIFAISAAVEIVAYTIFYFISIRNSKEDWASYFLQLINSAGITIIRSLAVAFVNLCTKRSELLTDETMFRIHTSC